MKTQYMRELIAIKENGNFSKAAASLYMTQPALSRHIADMEKELNIKLLKRDKHKVEFTEAGVIVCQNFRKILQTYDNLQNEIAGLKLGMTGQIRLGMLYYSIRQDFSAVIARFQEEYPNVKIKRYSYQPQEVFRALSEERIDIGVLPRAEYPDASFLRFQNLSQNRMEIMMSSTHPLASKKQIRLEDIQEETTIWLSDDPVSNKAYLDALKNCGYIPKYTIETDNIDTVPSAILKKNGIYIKPEGFNVAGYEHDILVRPIESDKLYVIKAYAYHANNSNPLIELFLNTAKDIIV